jgi:hypothetical protein
MDTLKRKANYNCLSVYVKNGWMDHEEILFWQQPKLKFIGFYSPKWYLQACILHLMLELLSVCKNA